MKMVKLFIFGLSLVSSAFLSYSINALELEVVKTNIIYESEPEEPPEEPSPEEDCD